jgi:hypothetical protein
MHYPDKPPRHRVSGQSNLKLRVQFLLSKSVHFRTSLDRLTALALRQVYQAYTDSAAIESEGHPEAACAAADAPGASRDRVWHHLCDDDADDAEFAVFLR